MVVCCIQEGYTPLHNPCKKGHEEVALLLIEHGADVNAMDKVRVMTDDYYIFIFIITIKWYQIYDNYYYKYCLYD